MFRLISLLLVLVLLFPMTLFAQSDSESDETSGILLELSDGQSIGPLLLFSDVIATTPIVSNAPHTADRFATGSVHFQQAGDYELVIDFFEVGEIDYGDTTSGMLDSMQATGDCFNNVARQQGLNAIISMNCPGSVTFHFFTNTHYIVLLVFEGSLPIPAAGSEGKEN